MRHLPVYILIDTSGSMVGEPIESVKVGLADMIATLRLDPYALETACISRVMRIILVMFITSVRRLTIRHITLQE